MVPPVLLPSKWLVSLWRENVVQIGSHQSNKKLELLEDRDFVLHHFKPHFLIIFLIYCFVNIVLLTNYQNEIFQGVKQLICDDCMAQIEHHFSKITRKTCSLLETFRLYLLILTDSIKSEKRCQFSSLNMIITTH